MTTLEKQMFDNGWVKNPNCDSHWYAGYSGKLEPVHPLEVHLSSGPCGSIWIHCREFGSKDRIGFPVMNFATVEALHSYLSKNGRKEEALPAYENSWDWTDECDIENGNHRI